MCNPDRWLEDQADREGMRNRAELAYETRLWDIHDRYLEIYSDDDAEASGNVYEYERRIWRQATADVLDAERERG